MKTPCFGCNNRHQGCHADCEKYSKWSAKRDEAKAALKKEAEAIHLVSTTSARLRGYR